MLFAIWKFYTETTTSTNIAMATRLRPGVYAPVLTPFKTDGSEDIDIHAFKASISRLAKAGVGLVLSGTLGEGNLLSREERVTLITAARELLNAQKPNNQVPIIAGIGGGSVKETVLQARDAGEAGADAV